MDLFDFLCHESMLCVLIRIASLRYQVGSDKGTQHLLLCRTIKIIPNYLQLLPLI